MTLARSIFCCPYIRTTEYLTRMATQTASTDVPRESSAAALDLDRNSPLPLYAQVKRRLQAMIVAGEHPGDRFYTEQELCSMFAISRFTVRQAIQALVQDGFLRRVQGQGTFVNREKFDEAFGPSMNFLDQWARVGRPLHFELRRFEVTECPAPHAAQLNLEAGASALAIERVRYNGQIVISYDFRYIHPDFALTVTRDAAIHQSLLELLSRQARLSRGENRVEAGLAGSEGARLLDVAESAPVLIREMTYYCDDGLPVMAGRSLYRADQVRYSFSVSLSGTGLGEGTTTLRSDVAPPPDAGVPA